MWENYRRYEQQTPSTYPRFIRWQGQHGPRRTPAQTGAADGILLLRHS